MIKTENLIELIEKELAREYTHGQLDREYFHEIVVRLENQPTITKEDIQGWAGEARDRVCAGMIWECIEDVMREMLTDIGVSITVDPDIKSGKE